jgi:FlaG/FlaF family flagellin (archaellin)
MNNTPERCTSWREISLILFIKGKGYNINMKKGITPVVAVVLLLIIAVAVVGLAYSFISGFFSATTGKAAVVVGAGRCDSASGQVTITMTNTGTNTLDISDVTVMLKSCTAGGTTACPAATSFTTGTGSTWPLNLGATGTIEEVDDITYDYCGLGNICFYDVVVGGFPTTVRADC